MNRSRLGAIVAFVCVCLFFVLLGCWLRVICDPEWLQYDTSKNPPTVRPWAVEADCYSQLARVQRILAGDGLIQNHFKVENWPEGLEPSTTAPFDYVIILLYAPLKLFTAYPLDWAGALVSPALWIALVFFWIFFRSREFNLTGRALFVVLASLVPSIIWATAFGRPRHQSLILLLMAIAMTAEYERWHIELTPKRIWHIFAGIIWGFACWTSLFEPSLIVGIIIIYNLIVRRRESPAFLISFGSVMLVALLLEGYHIYIPPPEYHVPLLRWWATIAEVRGIGYASFMQQMLLVSSLFLVPFMAWRLLSRDGDRRADALFILLTVLLGVLAFYQLRWIYYSTLAELFLIVRYCQVTPTRWTRIVVMAVILLGLVYDNLEQIAERAITPSNQPSPELAVLSRSIDQPGGILAPWWLSPGLLYFSGQPIVSGSSHCGISGILDSAKFFSTSSWTEAEAVLKNRQVRWIVVYDNSYDYYPLLNTARGILGMSLYDKDTTEADSTMAQILVNDRVNLMPPYLQLRAVTPSLKLYEYVPKEK